MVRLPTAERVAREQNSYSRFWFRFLEIIPGALAWLTLLAPFVLALYAPLWVTVAVILLDVFWLLRSLNYGAILLRGYHQLQSIMKVNWRKKIEQTDTLTVDDHQELGTIPWRELYHAVILTTYKESPDILEASLDSILESDYPAEQVIIVLATEERAGIQAKTIADELTAKYAHRFSHWIVSVHPDDIVGEVKAKGANASWAARQLVTYTEQRGIPFDRVIVSTADADSRLHKQYFARLSYVYMSTPDRVQACYQPIAMYFNNIWKAPILSRIMAFSTTFWQLIESMRGYRLITFATHATSLQTLVDTNFWCTSIVNEDSRQYFRAYFHYNGQFRTIPLFIPIYMDAVEVGSFWSTMRGLYVQQQRWAYGVEHFPYIVLESLRHKKIPAMSRFVRVARAFTGAYTWATTAFFLTYVGWLPLLLNAQFHTNVAAANFPQVTQMLLSLTWVGLLISGVITLLILRTAYSGKVKVAGFFTMFLQWILVPIATLFFGALPGLDAITRLMLGKYLGFRVTEKAPVRTYA
jgi:cellulose synthase/poly-beta-1,6-N-acetylglucosamine synthase-like glycosyltransferase